MFGHGVAGGLMNTAEAVQSGAFVTAAYSMYGADPGNLTPAKNADFPAGYDIAAWIQMSDFVGDGAQSAFYGFVAEAQDRSAPYVLALRGTEGFAEWWDDFHWGLVPFRVPASGSVADGFATIYDTIAVVPSGSPVARDSVAVAQPGSFAGAVARTVRQRHAQRGAPAAAPAPAIAVAGHSLGAALLTLYVMENANQERLSNPSVYTFASPRVGDATFAQAFDALSLTSWRIVNAPDLVPNFPPDLLGYVHVDAQYLVDSSAVALGTPSCAHALNTYLHVLEPGAVPLAAGCSL
jgi:hypothetical protein